MRSNWVSKRRTTNSEEWGRHAPPRFSPRGEGEGSVPGGAVAPVAATSSLRHSVVSDIRLATSERDGRLIRIASRVTLI